MLIRLLIIVFGLSCSLLHSAENKDKNYTIHIVQEAWHTGIIFKVSDVPASVFMEIENYFSQTYLEVSWGDEKYYQLPKPGIFVGAAAVLWPTQSVIRINAFSQEIQHYYAQATIMKVTMSKENFLDLCRFVNDSFERDDSGNIQPSAIYRKSSFYFLAKRKYSLFNTCNTWVMLAFKSSGFDASTFFLITANQLFRRLNKINNTVMYSLNHT